jgi:vesicular inhibitory amino acid transporter
VLTAYTKYTLTLLPLAEGVAELLPPPKTPAAQLAVSTAVRTFLGLASLGVAVSIPSFGHLSALMGSVVTVLISIAFPVILYSRVFADSLTWVDYVQLSLTLCVAAVCGVYGLYAAIIGVGGA